MKPKPRFDPQIYNRAQTAIAHGALTNSKRAESFIRGIYPTHVSSSQGCFVTDTNGNRYIDFIAGLGAHLLGAAEEEVVRAIVAQAPKATTHSLPSELEVEVAERVKEFFPFVDRIRFLKTGSDACTAAVRIARAHMHHIEGKPLKSSRDTIGVEGYHGWHDDFVVLTPPATGCPERWANYRSILLEPLGIDVRLKINNLAAVIVEPVITDNSPERIDYLRYLRKRCTETGTLLIFDEVITGLRFPNYSVSQHYGIIPDLICLGKAMANGMPLSIVGGKADLMDADYFVSSTFAGETLSLAACKKTLDLLLNKYKITHLWEKGAHFIEQFNALWPEGIQLKGYPTRANFQCEKNLKDLFFQESCKAGILIGPTLFFTFPHIEIMDQALSIFADILTRIRLGNVKLEGEPAKVPYAEGVRTKT